MILDNEQLGALFYADLSDEAAAQLADLLYQIFVAFEEHYWSQIRQHYRHDPDHHDTRQLDFFRPAADPNNPF